MAAFFKKYKYVLIGAAAIAVVLAVAFFSGGSLRVEEPSPAVQPSVSETLATQASQAETTAETPASTAVNQATTNTTAAASSAPSTTAALKNAEKTTAAAVQTTAATVPATQDRYHTDQVPSDKPQPVEPQKQTKTSVARKCTISISCASVLSRLDELDEGVAAIVPSDGYFLKPEQVTFREGENVFDVLSRVCKSKKIHMEFTNTPLYNSVYIEGIGNLYEFDCGSASGWMYAVNGWFPNYGCSRYALHDGDVIEWQYTCNLGRDIGGDYINQYSDE